MKKIISLILTLMLTFMMSVSGFAETNATTTTVNGETITTEVIQDDALYRIVETSDSSGTYMTKFNKTTNEVSVFKEGELQQSEVITPKDPSSPTSDPPVTKDSPSYVTGPTDSGTYTEKGTDYWFDLYYKVSFYENDTVGWTISLSDAAYPYYKETSTNRDDLENFREAVNTAETKEDTVIATAGAAVASLYAGVLSSGLTGGTSVIVGVLLAIGGGLTAAIAGFEAFDANRDAEYYYYRLKS
ncbi:geobacillin-26 family protein [Fictibacillus sp. NPDC058756]|uniref:geobacillin-26 family protein n=1 Tax=Fictibacillus sp. NPDC058756 TaxID=3346625 RepID=UPI0036B0B749